MLSIASKRTIPVARSVRGLRTPGKERRARLATSTASASQSANNNRRVVSRRAWLEIKESRGIKRKPPDPSKRPLSADEKPWPRNLQIAGYAASAVAVPYIILWTITSNPTLREWFGPYMPLEKLRIYFGTLEWDAQSYTDQMEDAKKKLKEGKAPDSVDESLIGYYQFPEEEPFHVREQQKAIETLNESDLVVTMSASSSSSLQIEDVVTKSVAAKTIANEKNLSELFYSSSASTQSDNTAVAVDFLDQNNLEDTVNKSNAEMRQPLSGGSLMTDVESMASNYGTSDSSSASQRLARDTQVASKWTYTQSQQQASGKPSQEGISGASSISQLTDVEMRMGQLEHNISELEASLRDPNSTRAIDDMTTDLRNAKRELSKLRWKRRFGLV